MKVCLISDIHFGVKKNKDIFIESQLKFFRDELVPYLKENGINTIFILGDLFDNRSALNVMIKNEVFNLFEDTLKDFNIFLLVGNHDSYFTNSIDVNSLKFFKKFENVILVEEPMTLKIDNTNILLTPWVVDYEKFDNYMRGIDIDIVMGHFDITGFKMNKTSISQNGLNWEVFRFVKKVFTGHFHHRSTQKMGDTEITYIGSPFQFDRGDIDEDRGFVTLDLKTLKYEYINNNKSIKFKKINYPEKIDKSKIEGNLIDIYVDTSSDINEKQFEKYVAEIEACNPADVPTVFFINKSTETENDLVLTSENISSIPELMKAYLKTLTLKVDRDTLYEYLMSLYNDSKGEDDD